MATMLARFLRLAAGCALAALSVAAEDPAGDAAPRPTVRAQLHENLKARLLALPVASAQLPAAAATATKPADDVVKLSPFVVKVIPFPTNTAIDTTLEKARALDSHALYKKGGREILQPPHPAPVSGVPGLRRFEVNLIQLKF